MDLDREVPGLGDRPEPIDRLAGHHRQVDRLDVGRPLRGVEPGQPEEVLEHPSHPLGLVVDTLERGPGPGHVALAGEGEARLGLDDRERRPQLVRRVGGEVELAAARCLDRRRDPPADPERAEEHRPEEERRDQQLRDDHVLAGLADRLERLADHDPVVADGLAGEPEIDAVDRRGDRPADAGVLGGKGRVRAVGVDLAARIDGPDHDRGAAEPLRRRGLVRVVVVAVVVVEPDERCRDPLVDLVGEVALDDRDHADADREVRGRDDRRREEGDADRDPADARQRRGGHGQDSSSR